MRRPAWLALGVVVLLGATPVGAAEDTVRHSGVIESLDPEASRLVLAVVEASRTSDTRMEVERLSVRVTPRTAVERVRRAASATSGFAGDFVVGPAARGDLRSGVYATIEMRRTEGALEAVKIVLTDVE
jgi:hypothetical protein